MEYNRPETYLDGAVLYIDKPLTWTSFDVVNKIRKSLRQQLGIKKIKVGQAYIAQVRLGATTPSFDMETEVDHTYPWEQITSDKIKQALLKLSGDQEQVPPLFSAKSVDGKRAYAMARKGKQMELKSQMVHISRLELVSQELPDLILEVECSKGTYIRSLARDLGLLLDSGAYLTGLRRTRIGPYHVDKAVSLENFIEKLKLL
jgi:tRNA pseudouridine55 synthase